MNTSARSTPDDVFEVVLMDIFAMVDSTIGRVCKVYTNLEAV